MGKALFASLNKSSVKSKRQFILSAMMLANFMSAVEVTIVATAIPTIVSDLGGFRLFSWVFSAFLLTQGITIPIYGKLSDIYGRKKIFAFGTVLFILGSALCGFAGNMYILILFRAIQGLGAGAVLPVSQTIIGDIYNLEEQAKIQGYLSSVWGISAVIGPAIGGIIVQNFAWAWIFFINIPIGIIAAFMTSFYLHEDLIKLKETVRFKLKSEFSDRQNQIRIDYAGSILMMLAISFLLVALLEVGSQWKLTDIKFIGMIISSIILFIILGFVEKRAEDPVIHFDLLKMPVILFPDILSMIVGITTISISSIIPMFAQGVLGATPMAAGFLLAAMSIGWPIASSQSGKLILKKGFRFTGVAGALILIIGSVLLLLVTKNSNYFSAAVFIFIIGLGLGLTSTTSIVAVQRAVSWSKRGVATSSNAFMRMIGGTFGATLFGGLLNDYMKSNLPQSKKNLDIIKMLIDPVQRAELSPSYIEELRDILAGAVHNSYYFLLAIVVLGVIAAYLIPKKIKKESI